MESLFDLLTQTADGAYAVDREQRVVFWNQAAHAILGYRADEVLGRPCHELLGGRDEFDQPFCRKNCLPVSSARAGKLMSTRKVKARTKSGRSVWLSLSTVVVPSNWRELSFLAHLFRDVTQEKTLESDYKQLLRALALSAQQKIDEMEDGTPTLGKVSELSQREREILILMARGVGTRNIAQRLSISLATVRNHVSRILAKLGVHNRMEAVMLALRDGLVAVPRVAPESGREDPYSRPY